MTTGQMMFYAGAGLLGLTVLLAIVFAIKKPKYQPQNLTGESVTAPMRNGYPTQEVTREAEAAGTTEFMEEQPGVAAATEFMSADDDPAARPTEMIEAAETEYLRQ